MSDASLTVLKFCLLALLYIFLLRVVFVVVRELRGTPATAVVAPPPSAPAAKARKRAWSLVVVEPESDRGHAYDVDGEATIGRGGGCTVPLTHDTFISQVHARVFDRGGKLWVEDVGSTNGTFVNGKQLTKPVEVRKGDQIKVGETVLAAERA
jgi:hypothetical protein